MNEEVKQDTTEDFEPVVLWSIKLMTGENVITELYESEDENNPNFVMVNPISVQHTITQDGEMSSARPYDKMTEEDTFEIHESAFLSEPKEVNSFYREFYVKALMFEFAKRARTELSNYEKFDSEIYNQKKIEIESALDMAAQFLEERFAVNLSKDEENYQIPKNQVLH